VLVLGASGGTAMAAVQLAKLAGARVYAVTAARRRWSGSAPWGRTWSTTVTEVDFSREVFRDTGRRGVDVVVENVGEATWQGSLRSLARGGRLVTYGATAGHRGETDLRLLFWKQLQIIGTTMASRAEFEEMLRAVEQAGIVPPSSTG
jgi:NADPH:quinone reductase-like Zn-dependent oxidoreductase